MDNVTGLTNKTIWIPKVYMCITLLNWIWIPQYHMELTNSLSSFLQLSIQTIRGSYISWLGGEILAGGEVISRNYTLSEMPLFVKSGSIIPMRTDDFGMRVYISVQCNTCLCYCLCLSSLLVLVAIFFRAPWISSGDTKDAQANGVCWRCSSVCTLLL